MLGARFTVEITEHDCLPSTENEMNFVVYVEKLRNGIKLYTAPDAHKNPFEFSRN